MQYDCFNLQFYCSLFTVVVFVICSSTVRYLQWYRKLSAVVP